MNAKKTVKKFLAPNWVPMIIALLIPFFNALALIVLLFNYLPRQFRANKNVKNLEENGKLEQAAAEILSGDSKRFMNGKVVLSAHYLFCKGNGYVFSYDELVWGYRHRQTNSILFIPFMVIDSLYLATKTMKPTQVASMGKDKTDEVKNSLLEIYKHNPSCLLGYTDEIRAKYKAFAKG